MLILLNSLEKPIKKIIKFLIPILLLTSSCATLQKGFESITCSLNTKCSLSKLEPEIRSEIKELTESAEKKYKPDNRTFVRYAERYVSLDSDGHYWRRNDEAHNDYFVLLDCKKLLKVISLRGLSGNNYSPSSYVKFLFPEIKGPTYSEGIARTLPPLYYKKLTGKYPARYTRLASAERATSDWSFIVTTGRHDDITMYFHMDSDFYYSEKGEIESFTLSFRFDEKEGKLLPYLNYEFKPESNGRYSAPRKILFFSRDRQNQVTVNYQGGIEMPLSDKQIKGIDKIFRNKKYITIRVQDGSKQHFDIQITNQDFFIQDSLAGKVDFKYSYEKDFKTESISPNSNSLISTVALIDYYFKLKKGKVK